MLLPASIIFLPSIVLGETWLVEKDGTGHYLYIQDAISACSVGDSIVIGPGRFDDFHPLIAPAWESQAIVGVDVDSLTIIGAGIDVTIVGPEAMYLTGNSPEPMGIATVDSVFLKVVGLTIANCDVGLYWPLGSVEVEDCGFYGFRVGSGVLAPGGASFLECHFFSTVVLSNGISAHNPCSSLEVRRCAFGSHYVNERGLAINGVSDFSVEECSFRLRNGIQCDGSTGTISYGSWSDSVSVGTWVTGGSQISLIGNQFNGQNASLYIEGGSIVGGEHNSFTGGAGIATIFLTGQSQVSLNSNDIIRSGEFAVKVGSYRDGPWHMDFGSNYWGTDDPDSVAAWIWDIEDDVHTGAIIEYLPMADASTPAVTRSMGSLKAMFR